MRKKTLSAAVLCAATVLSVAGLSATPAVAAEPAPKPKADFNGDGYADLAVGVPGATVGGKAKAGYVNVVWGGKKGLGGHGSTTVSQGAAGVPGTVEKDDGFGTAVSTGDMNGDGRTDIVVGTPGEDNSAGASAGTLTVLWGAKSGIKGGFTAANGAYARLYRKTRDRTQRYRIALLTGSILIWFGTSAIVGAVSDPDDEVNLGWHPKAEQVLWQPSLQEPRTRNSPLSGCDLPIARSVRAGTSAPLKSRTLRCAAQISSPVP